VRQETSAAHVLAEADTRAGRVCTRAIAGGVVATCATAVAPSAAFPAPAAYARKGRARAGAAAAADHSLRVARPRSAESPTRRVARNGLLNGLHRLPVCASIARETTAVPATELPRSQRRIHQRPVPLPSPSRAGQTALRRLRVLSLPCFGGYVAPWQVDHGLRRPQQRAKRRRVKAHAWRASRAADRSAHGRVRMMVAQAGLPAGSTRSHR
jgi:hypothetical protein